MKIFQITLSLSDTIQLIRCMQDEADSGKDIFNVFSEAPGFLNHSQVELFEEIHTDIQNGIPFTDIVEKHASVFPPGFVNAVNFGEAADNLLNVLQSYAEALVPFRDGLKKLKMNCRYPLILLVCAGALNLIFGFVLSPLFADDELFRMLGAVLISAGVLCLLPLVAYMLRLYFARAVITRKYVIPFLYSSRMAIKLPIVKDFLFAYGAALLRAAFEAGIAYPAIIKMLLKRTDNPRLVEVLEVIKAGIDEGYSLSDCFDQTYYFPPLLTSLARQGEISHDLPGAFERITKLYLYRLNNRLIGINALLYQIFLLTALAWSSLGILYWFEIIGKGMQALGWLVDEHTPSWGDIIARMTINAFGTLACAVAASLWVIFVFKNNIYKSRFRLFAIDCIRALLVYDIPIEDSLLILDAEHQNILSKTKHLITGIILGKPASGEINDTYRELFPAHIWSVVMGGVRSDRIPDSLDAAAEMIEASQEHSSKFWETLLFPLLTAGGACGVFTLLHFIVFPKFNKMGMELGIDIQQYEKYFLYSGLIMGIVAVILITAFVVKAWVFPAYRLRKTFSFIAKMDEWISVHVPLRGRWNKQQLLFAWLLHIDILLKSGIDESNALRIISEDTSSYLIQRVNQKLYNRLERGIDINGAVRDVLQKERGWGKKMPLISFSPEGELTGKQLFIRYILHQSDIHIMRVVRVVAPLMILSVGTAVALPLIGVFNVLLDICKAITN